MPRSDNPQLTRDCPRITIRLEPKQHRAVQQVARRYRTTPSSIIRQTIELFLTNLAPSTAPPTAARAKRKPRPAPTPAPPTAARAQRKKRAPRSR